ncbi:hypothetical protein [Streptomyces sp. NPDC097619]|uniref:hypothetical protein n=1 Tax=Streptomyces sp. NPDC097619 TaxID=3157228 RepID=UPI003333FC2C
MRRGPSIEDLVLVRTLPVDGDPFAELTAATRLEDVGKGRRGAVLTRPSAPDGAVPLVRTTTRYAAPAQRFRPVHERLAREVRELTAAPLAFDNALVETYTNAYTKMGAHSDQALDLAEGSLIAVFSCYRHPDTTAPRTLVFETKESKESKQPTDADDGRDHGRPRGAGDRPDEGRDEGRAEAPGQVPAGRLEIPLAHGSVVAFSVAANRRLRHRIVLTAPGRPDEEWLGVTLRTSKTHLRFRDGRPHLPEGVPLTLADEDRSVESYRLRRRENTERDFVHPPVTHTLSPSDLLPPT